jgi:hypothetical protein
MGAVFKKRWFALMVLALTVGLAGCREADKGAPNKKERPQLPAENADKGEKK